MTKVTANKKSFLNLDGSILVSEMNKQLEPLKGPGRAIWKEADLTKDDFLDAESLKEGEILVTSAKNLAPVVKEKDKGKKKGKTKEEGKYTAILHVVMPSLDNLLPSEQQTALSTIYFKILEKAVAMDAKSIVLPFLGIKSCAVPIEEGVGVALRVIRDFLTANNYEEMCIENISLFTTDGEVSTAATKHEIYKSPVMRGKLPKQIAPDKSRLWTCVVHRLRESKGQSGLAVAQVPCDGLMQSLSSMTFDLSGVLTDLSHDPFFGASHEADLIMTRIGEFGIDWSNQSSHNLEICSRHLNHLLRDWNNILFKNVRVVDSKLKCSFPDHRGTRPSLKSNPAKVNKSDAIRWMKKKSTVIQAGIPMCESCEEYLRSSEFDEQAASQETRELESLMETDTMEDLVMQMDTMPKIPKKTPSTSDAKVKEAGLHYLDVLNCAEVGRRKNWNKISARQKRKKLSTLLTVVDAVCELIAPDAKEELKALLLNSMLNSKRKEECNHLKPLNKLLTDTAELFYRTESKMHRLFILASVASIELPVLQQYFHGLTSYMHQRARRVICNPVVDAENRIMRDRFEQGKVDWLLGFVLSPLIVLTIPYDARREKMDDGSVVQLPNYMRLQTQDEVYRMYRKFTIEEGEEGLLLKETTAKFILKLIAPTRRKNLTCVDEKVGDGMKAFDDMFDMVDDLEQRDFIIKDISLELTRQLQHSKSYLRGDYKAHIKKASNCADHCASFALSYSKDKRLAIDCSTGEHAHSHDSLCDRCELVKVSIEQLRDALQNAVDTTEDDSEREHFRTRCEELDVCEKAIVEMKRHQIRAAVSHGERAEFVENLKPGRALITLDWAQKLEPLHAREKQSDYYAKTGIAYHISHALTVIGTEYASHTSVHIVGPHIPQDGSAVSMITEAFLLELKEMGITSCIVRSDCAGCYRNGPLIRSLINMEKKTGMKIEGFLYSEAQAGKSDCDRGAASVKRKARDVVASKRSKIETKEDFYDVLTTGKLLNAVSIHLCTISGVQNITSQIPQITSYSSFTFEADSIRLRRHRSVGEGILFDFKKLLPCKGKMEITKSGGYTVDSGEKFWLTRGSVEEKNEPSAESTTDTPASSVSRMIPCTEENCIAEFTSFREFKKHLNRDKHTLKLERKTLHDYCATMISHSLDSHFSISAAKLRIAVETSVHNGVSELEEGWALRSSQKRNRNDQPARDLIREYFMKKRGEGKKCTPHELETYMKAQKKPGGKGRLISPLNSLSISQIKSLINGLLKKEYAQNQCIVTEEKKNDEEESEEEGEDDEYFIDDEEELSELVKKSSIFADDLKKRGQEETTGESDNEPPIKQGRRT